ncbi:MAG: hypothetical protein PUC26_04255 [Eubacteriales bacterium]|nr:hypothetical protein [Eubacteriales bacterium]
MKTSKKVSLHVQPFLQIAFCKALLSTASIIFSMALFFFLRLKWDGDYNNLHLADQGFAGSDNVIHVFLISLVIVGVAFGLRRICFSEEIRRQTSVLRNFVIPFMIGILFIAFSWFLWI